MTAPVTIMPFDTSAEVLQALLWQHNNATKLTALIKAKQAWLETNQTEFWKDWLHDVFDLRTANDFGLRVWSIILGVPINISNNPPATPRKSWGFGPLNLNFRNANFMPAAGNNTSLSTTEARMMLRIRYFALICRPCTVQINAWFAKAYPWITCLDNFDMAGVQYNFAQPISTALANVLARYDILPRPATLGEAGSIVTVKPVWAFGPLRQNFNHGNF